MAGLSTTGSISLGVAFVAGRNRVPRPAAGTTALVTAVVVLAAPESTMRLSVVIAGGWGGPHVLSRGKMLVSTSGTFRKGRVAPPRRRGACQDVGRRPCGG